MNKLKNWSSELKFHLDKYGTIFLDDEILKSRRIEHYDIPLYCKKIFSYYLKQWLDRVEQLIVENKKAKTTKNAGRWTEKELSELFAQALAEFLADPENNFAISLEKLALKKSANNELFERIKNTFEMEIDNEVFKQNTDQVKGNATKLEYTNYDKIINGSPSFIQKILI